MLIVFSQLDTSIKNKELKQKLIKQGCSVKYEDSDIVNTNNIDVVRALTIQPPSDKNKESTTVVFVGDLNTKRSAEALDELHRICNLRELALFNISAMS